MIKLLFSTTLLTFSLLSRNESCKAHKALHEPDNHICKKEIVLYDKEQARSIPIIIYSGSQNTKNLELPLVIVSHGYGLKNTQYSFIAQKLAALGFVVISVQHDLDTDPALPYSENIYEKRMPFWERGVKSLNFVISSTHKLDLKFKKKKVILIGHSNGGDISMMFADLYPKRVEKVISLDSLRYPFPDGLDILSLRAVDRTADKGVLPLTGAGIIQVPNARHIDMCDKGPREIKAQILNDILKFLDLESL